MAAGLLAALPLPAQQTSAPAPPQGQATQQKSDQKPDQKAEQKPDQKITPAQAKELFASVDQILSFASKDSDLSIQHSVKRRMTNRGEVEHYILSKMKDDKDAARLESSEIVLKKFGLLDRDFHLKPFIVSLLTEQIAGYYDSKTKTVNMLDWIAPDEQKPVLAHELTHALQDQHVDLEKWSDQSKDSIAKNVEEDNEHLATDEADTAREAVAEGQAMVVFLDWGLAPKGQSLAKLPDIAAQLDDMDGDDSDSPVMKRAPLLLKESLLFPYREGLNFEQVVLKDKGAKEAFAGTLDRPPGTSYEIMHPRAWERQEHPTLLTMPDIHPLIDADYAPYDIGVMGALDVRILTQLFAGKDAAQQLTPEWDGGMYYAAQSRAAKTPEEKDSTKSVALLYLSQWKSENAAAQFAAVYAANLKRKYMQVHIQPEDASEASGESVFTTEEGPVVIATVGRGVFISESFPLPLARKLELAMTGALHHSGEQQARVAMPTVPDGGAELSESLVRLLGRCGMMRAALRH
jgi:hypothetical protein